MRRAVTFAGYAARRLWPALVSAVQLVLVIGGLLLTIAACVRWPWLVLVLIGLAAIGYAIFWLGEAWDSFQIDFDLRLWKELRRGEWYQ